MVNFVALPGTGAMISHAMDCGWRNHDSICGGGRADHSAIHSVLLLKLFRWTGGTQLVLELVRGWVDFTGQTAVDCWPDVESRPWGR